MHRHGTSQERARGLTVIAARPVAVRLAVQTALPHRVICSLPGRVVYGGRLSRFCPSVSRIAIAMEGERWDFSLILSISRYAPGRTRGFCDLAIISQRECWNYAVWEKSRLGDYALKAPSAIISHQNVGLYPQSDRFALISHNSTDTHRPVPA